MSYSGGLADKMRRAEQLAGMVVAKTAADIEAGAKARTPPRIDTGAMLNGWQARQVGDLEWEVVNGVEYSKFNEYGTRHMAPHPMIIPSAEEARPGFEAAVGQVFQ